MDSRLFCQRPPPHRYFDVLPAAIKAQMLEDSQIREEDVAEIGAIWMDVKALGRLGRWQVYLFMLADAYATNQPFIVGGTVHAQIRDFQMQVVKHPLFEGEVELAGQVQRIWEYYANRRRNVVRLPQFHRAGNAPTYLTRHHKPSSGTVPPKCLI